MNHSSSEGDLPPHSSDVEEELRRVRLALDTVYAAQTAPAATTDEHPHWSHQRNLADRYLTSFQQTTVAWMVCDRLLQEPQVDPQATQQRRFFAAQTLHQKCGTAFHELPADSVGALRDSLLSYYFQSAASVAVTNRLAMAIAALAIQMGWHSVIQDFLSSDPARWPLVLFFLRALPEECASDRLYFAHDVVNETNRYAMRDQLIADSPRVFEFLQHCRNHHQPHHDPDRVWQVLHHWIRYVPVRPDVLTQTPLVGLAVQTLAQAGQHSHQLSSHDSLEAAADVLVEVLRMYPSRLPANEGLVRHMIPLLSQLPLEQVLPNNDHASDDLDEDVQRAYCRVVTEMGESYLTWILSPQWDQARQLVTWILQCAGRIPDVEMASITLHFWYRFVLDMEMIEPDPWRQELIDVYEGHLLDLISVCAQHLMKYPEDETLTGDRLDDFHKHRFYVSETIEDCCRLLGGAAVVHRMSQLLQTAVQNMGKKPHRWQGIEACLDCLCALHRFIPNDEATVLPAVFELLPQLPTDNIPPLRATASRTIGKYASWLARHPNYLQPLLPFLAQGLHIPECAKSVAVAIKELCCYSNPGNFDISGPVLQLYQEVSQSGTLAIEDELEILEGVCHAVSRKVQDAARQGHNTSGLLESLVNPIGQRLTNNLVDQSVSARRAVAEIDRLAVLVQFLNLPTQPDGCHSMVALLQSLWSVLEQTGRRHAQDPHMAERICRLYKYTLRCGRKEVVLPLLHPLMHQLTQAYHFSHQSPYLYAASICLTEFGRDAQQSQALYDMIANMAETTFSFMKNLDDFRNHPDVMEEFFYLMDRMMIHCPDPLIQSPLLASLLQCSAMTLELDHPGVNKGTLKFLESTFAHATRLAEQQGSERTRAGLEKVLQTHAQPNVVNLVRALSGDLPCYGPNIPDILWYAMRLGPVHGWISSFWSSAAGQAVPSERVRRDLLATFHATLSQDEFRLALRSYESVCAQERRFRRA